jgi:transposase-like protein
MFKRRRFPVEIILVCVRWYRRHLQKKMRGARAHMRAYVRRLDTSLDIPVPRLY